jgi:hypothetical protein
MRGNAVTTELGVGNTAWSVVCVLFSVINSSFKLFKCDLIVELCLISELKVGFYYLLCLN